VSTDKARFLDNLRAVGERLRSERVRMMLEQPEFAELGHAKRASQSNYENGKSHLGIDYLLHLKQHGVDIGYIVTGYRTDGSLGYMEQQLLQMFEKLPSHQKQTILELLIHLTGSYADLRELPTSGRSLHSPRLGYKPPPEDL
jgi:transcriptional regulator with XRE-family HTH domain